MGRIWISGPHLGPVHSTLWSSGRRRKGGSNSYAGRFILAVILTGATFGVSPVLGALLVTAEVVTVVVLLVRYLRPAKPKPTARKPAQSAQAAKAAGWRADHAP